MIRKPVNVRGIFVAASPSFQLTHVIIVQSLLKNDVRWIREYGQVWSQRRKAGRPDAA